MFAKKISYYLIFFVLLAVANHVSIAQNSTDSIETAITNEHDIIKKAQLYQQLSLEYKSSNLNKSEKMARQALILVEKTDNDKITGFLHAQLGDIAFLQDSLNKAEKEYDIAIPFLNESGEFPRLILVYISLGNRFVEKGNYTQALSHYLQGLRISKESNDTSYLAKLYNNLGVVFINMNDQKTAWD